MKRYKILVFVLVAILVVILSSCAKPADVASRNLSTAADNFEVNRRVHFYNGITGEDFLVIEGRCALGNSDSAGSLSVICKTSDTTFKKFFLGLSDNVTYWTEDVESTGTSVYNYRVIMRPSTIIPDLELDIP